MDAPKDWSEGQIALGKMAARCLYQDEVLRPEIIEALSHEHFTPEFTTDNAAIAAAEAYEELWQANGGKGPDGSKVAIHLRDLLDLIETATEAGAQLEQLIAQTTSTSRNTQISPVEERMVRNRLQHAEEEERKKLDKKWQKIWDGFARQ